MASADEPTSGAIEVLLVIDDDAYDRLGSVVRYLCVGMLDEPVRMRVLWRGARRREEDRIGPAEVVYASRRWLRREPGAAEVLGWIGGRPPDVVHCLSGHLARWTDPWARQWNAELMVHLTDREDVRQLNRAGPLARTTAIPTTSALREAVLARHAELADRAPVVPLGVPAHGEPACLAQPERIPAVLVTETLTRDCGLDLVLRALKTILERGQEVQLFILAVGPAEPMFRRHVEKLGLRAHVTFAGGMQGWAVLEEAMSGADFLIVANVHRRFTVSTLMAMAAGLAIVAPAGSTEDYLIEGTTASLFDPEHPGQLAQKWAALLEDRTSAQRLAHGALDYVRTHHQASAMAAAVAAAYRRLCGSAAAPAAV